MSTDTQQVFTPQNQTMHCPMYKMIQNNVMIVTETDGPIALGSVYDANYPSYTSLMPWINLRHTTFNLLGVNVIDGHNGMNVNTMVRVVRTLNSIVNYDLSIKIDVSEIDSLYFRVTMMPEETDVFTIDAFCHGLQMAGWETGTVDNDGEESTYFFDVLYSYGQ